MSWLAEFYHRNRNKIIAYEREEVARESRARLATFAEATFEGIVESEEGRIVDCNEQFARMLGYSVAELRGVKIVSLIAAEDRDRVMSSIGGNPEPVIEQELVRKDGTRVMVEAHGRSLPLGGEVRHTVFRDITDRKEAEEALRKAHDELEIRVQERTEELAKSQQRLQLLASQLLLAQEKERKRVAVELHDGLLSELAATKFLLEGKLSLWEKGKISDLGELKKVADVLGIAMTEARRIMNNLHPSILDELGLIAAMNWLCREYQKSYPHILVETKIGVTEGDISDSIRVVIFRVLQEALNNFARHGKGDRVELSLSKADRIFEFKIRDNGQGFDVGAAQKGLGLESMRERVEVSGGTFEIESVIGQGTTIRGIWNLS